MGITPRGMVCLIAASMCGAAAACDTGGDDVDDGGRGTDAGRADGGRPDSGPGDTDGGLTDGGRQPPSVTVANQTLDLSTVVTIAAVVSDGPGWLVIHEDASGPGPVIGMTQVSAGNNAGVSVALDRPAGASETLHAMLHVDAGTVGTYEFPGPDAPVSVEGAIVNEPFVVTVPEGTPAVRLRASVSAGPDWVFSAVEPARYADTVEGGGGDPTLLLRNDWRFEIVYTPSGHHFELVGAGNVVQLDQGGGDTGTLEGNPSIGWDEPGGAAIRFTVSPAFRAGVNAYRCGIHTSTMRGDITFRAP